MNLILYRPESEVRSLRQAMGRFMEDVLTWPVYRPFTFFGDGLYELMPLDIEQTKNQLMIKASLPGVKLGDIDISISDNVLTIKGETKEEEKTKEAEYVCRERFIGEFSRSLSLPEGLDTEKIEAVMDNGVLTVTIPRSEKAKPKSIKVNAIAPKN